jgi:hypothetical protein
MAVSFGSPIDLGKLELQNARIHNLASFPASPVEGQLVYLTTDDNLYVYANAAWVDLTAQGVTYTAGSGISIAGTTISADTGTTSGKVAAGDDSRFPTSDEKAALAGTSGSPSTSNRYVTDGDSRLTNSRTPSGAAGGDLTGTYPNPTIGSGAVTSSKIADGTIVDGDISASAGIATSKISGFDTQVRTSRLDQMAAPTASVSLNSQKITNLAEGTASSDAATLGQVQAASSGLDVKASVRAATLGSNITIATALTPSSTLDGISLISGDRVLIKDQTDPIENGIYLVGSTPTRASDGLFGGAFVFVEQGTTNADTGWVVTTNGPITPGTDANAWSVFSRAGEIQAGSGLQKSGGTLSVDSTVARTTGATFTGKVEVSHASDPAFKVGAGHGSGAALDAGSKKIVSLADPASAQDGATKNYVDSQVSAGTYAANVGDGSSTTITVSHGLGTRDVIVQVYEAGSPYSEIIVEVKRSTTSAVDLVFAAAPTSNQYRVVVRK